MKKLLLLTVLTLFTAQANASTSKYKCFTGVPADKAFYECTVGQAINNDNPIFFLYYSGYVHGMAHSTLLSNRFPKLTFEQVAGCHNVSLQILNGIVFDKLKAADISFDDDYKIVLHYAYITRATECITKELASSPQ